MGLNRSKYSQAHEREEMEEDDEMDKMSFGRACTRQSFEANELFDDEYELSRKQQSYQNRRKMDRIRPQDPAIGSRD